MELCHHYAIMLNQEPARFVKKTETYDDVCRPKRSARWRDLGVGKNMSPLPPPFQKQSTEEKNIRHCDHF